MRLKTPNLILFIVVYLEKNLHLFWLGLFGFMAYQPL